MNTEERIRAIWASADEPCIEAMTYEGGSSFARNFEIESVISDFPSQADESDNENNDHNLGFEAIPEEFRPSKRWILKVTEKPEDICDLECTGAKSNPISVHRTEIRHTDENSRMESGLLIKESSFPNAETKKANLCKEDNSSRDTSKDEKEFDRGDLSLIFPSEVHKQYGEIPAFQDVSPKSESCGGKSYHENVKHLANKLSEIHLSSGNISAVNQTDKKITQPFTPKQSKFRPYISNNNSKEITPKTNVTKLSNFPEDLITRNENMKGFPDKFSKLSFELDSAFDADQDVTEVSHLQTPRQSKLWPYISNNKTAEISSKCKATKLSSFANNHVNLKYETAPKNYNNTKITSLKVIDNETRHNIVWKNDLCAKRIPKTNRSSCSTSSPETHIKHVAQDKINKERTFLNSVYRESNPMRSVSNKFCNYTHSKDKTDVQRTKDTQRNKVQTSKNHHQHHRVVNHENRMSESIPIVIKHEVKVTHVNKLCHRERNSKKVNKERCNSVKTIAARNAFESTRENNFAGMRKREITWNILSDSDDYLNYSKDTFEHQKESVQKYEKNLNSDRRRNRKCKLRDVLSDSDEGSYHNASEETGENSNQVAKESAARESDIYKKSCDNVNTCSLTNESAALLIQYVKDIIDLMIGSQTAADLFLSYYDEWVSTRSQTIILFEQLLRSIKNASKKDSKVQEIVQITGATANIASAIPNVYVSMAGKIICLLSSLISKICGSASSLQSLDIDEFSIMRCLQEDIDVTSTFYMHGLQCNEQFQETRKLFEKFHQNIIEGKYPCAAQSPELSDFFNEITEFNPNHRYYFKRLQKCFEKLSRKNTLAPIKVLCEAIADCPKAMTIIGELDWIFNDEGFENNYLNNIFEKISNPLQKDSSTITDLLKELQNCIIELTRSRRSVKEVISRLIASRDHKN